MPDVTLSGRARAGFVGGSGKWFTLTARPNGLVLHCFKDYELLASDIVRLEPDGPGALARGIRIVHTVPGYPKRLQFSCSGGVERIRAALVEAGFDTGKLAPAQQGFQPWHALVALLVILTLGNLLFGHHLP